MAYPKLTMPELTKVHERALAGESLYALAREHDLSLSALSGRLRHHFGFVADAFAPATVVMPADEGTLAYIAGLLDSEGTITRSGSYGNYRVKFAMTCYEVIAWLARLDGSTPSSFPARSERHQPIHEWHIDRHRDVEVFLRAILPYLRVKREQALEALNQESRWWKDGAPRAGV